MWGRATRAMLLFRPLSGYSTNTQASAGLIVSARVSVCPGVRMFQFPLRLLFRYTPQLNMVLTVGEFVVSDGTNTWDNCPGWDDVLFHLGNWDRAAAGVKNSGLWHLFDDCWAGDGTAGVAVLGSACQNSPANLPSGSITNSNVGTSS